MDSLATDIIQGAQAIAFETGLKVRTVYKLAERGELPVFKLGSMLCARRSELRERLSSKAVG